MRYTIIALPSTDAISPTCVYKGDSFLDAWLHAMTCQSRMMGYLVGECNEAGEKVKATKHDWRGRVLAEWQA